MKEEQRLTFAVDVDGVLGDYHGAFTRFVAEQTGIDPADLPEPTAWSYHDVWPNVFSCEDDFLAMHARAVGEGRIFETMQPMRGAAEALWMLSDAEVDIRIVTSRLVRNRMHADVCAQTVAWLDANNIPYREIVFAKSDKRDIRADVAVDDAPKNVLAWRSVGVPTFVFDHPYNREVPGMRVKTWSALARKVLELKAHRESDPVAGWLTS